MEDGVHGAFVGEKISKVRWKPDFNESDIFLTGSWDNEVSNVLCKVIRSWIANWTQLLRCSIFINT